MADDIYDDGRGWLTGVHGDGFSSDMSPIQGLIREYERVAATAQGQRLGAAIAKLLADGDPVMRRRALQFFEIVDSPAASAVLPIVRGDRAAYRDVFAEGDDADLEWHLMRVLGKLVRSSSDARSAARREILSADGRPRGLAAGLAEADPDWVRQHYDEIIAQHPKTKLALDRNLK